MTTSRRWRAARFGFAVCVWALLDAGVASAQPVPADRTLADLGAPLFQRYCASCHGTQGKGDGPAAASLRTKPADLTHIAARRGGKFPDGEIAQKIDGRFTVVAHGSREMPVWGEVFSHGIPEAGTAEAISRGNVAVLVEYLKTLQMPDQGSAAPPGAKGQDSAQETRARMADIFAAMRFLLPLSLDADAFESDLQRPRVEQALALLDRSATSLADHGSSQEVPFAHLSRSLAIDARDIHIRYQQGHAREARYLVQTLTETCIACHSRLPAASDAPRSEAFVAEVATQNLRTPQRARLAYATRQFDDAQDLYETAIVDPAITATDIDLEGHLDDYLELEIRVRQDPARAARTLERFAARKDLSPALREQVGHWREALLKLAARKRADAPLVTARAEVAAAESARPERDDRDSLVEYLDASSLLHRSVAAEGASAAQQADAFLLLGVIETRIGRSFWLSQAESYLETAIRLAPGKPVARDAYARLEEFLTAGYSGSAGTSLPPDVQQKLEQLRGISEGASG
jgi:mono/diheme cytochrome c family protein